VSLIVSRWVSLKLRSMLPRYPGAQTEAQVAIVTRSRIATTALLVMTLLNTPSLAQVGVPDLTPCTPSGHGHDYTVGPGQPYPTLESVPWENLGPGDTVRIAWSPTPYRGKILLAAQGTAEAPVRVCGLRGPGGERPQIDGRGALTRPELAVEFGSEQVDSSVGVSSRVLQQARGIVVVDRLRSRQGWKDYPRHIRIDGLAIGHARPESSFRDAEGRTQRYRDFGACIWVQRGHHISIADNEIHDCVMGVFSRSTDEGDFELTRDLLLSGNHFHGHGLPGNDKLHSTYTQSVGTTIEFNRYGPLHPDALGHSVKDRSVGTVVRYNLIEAGAHTIDLVEAEDFPHTATADPAYRRAFVYGNLIFHRGEAGSLIHYGGDHVDSQPDRSWGEPIFRQGTLYFYNNTVQITTGPRSWLFQLSTTLESAEVFNNVFLHDPGVTTRNLRMRQEVGKAWSGDGLLRLGTNWISPGVVDNANPWLKLGGQVVGLDRQLGGTGPSVDGKTLRPLPASALIDASTPLPAPAAAHPVLYQIDRSAVISARQVTGRTLDLGSLEASSPRQPTDAAHQSTKIRENPHK